MISSPASPVVLTVPEGDVLQAWERGAVKGADWTPIRLGLFRAETLIGDAAILRRTLPLVEPFYYALRRPL